MNSPFLETYSGNITTLLQCGSLCIGDPDALSEFILRLLKETTIDLNYDQIEGILISCLETLEVNDV